MENAIVDRVNVGRCWLLGALLVSAACGDEGRDASMWIDLDDDEGSMFDEGPDGLGTAINPTPRVPGFDISISPSGDDIELQWAAQGAGATYEVWRSSNPYFSPGDPGATLLVAGVVGANHVDVGGNDDTNAYYRVQADHGALSTTVGKYVHSVYGGFNKISQPLDTGLASAEDFGAQFPGYFQMAHQWDASAQSWQTWIPGGSLASFEYGLGSSPIARAASGTAATHHQFGYVPEFDEVQVALEPGDNIVTLPLSYGDTTAGEVLASLESGVRVGTWDNQAQVLIWFDGVTGPDFAVDAGAHLHLDVAAPSTWPGPSYGPSTDPLDGIGELEVLTSGYGFTEGVLWDPSEQELLFVDLAADSVYAWDEASGASLRRGPSGAYTNGMAFDAAGNRLECEHATQRVTRHLDDGTVEVVAQDFGGTVFNSPNDVAVHGSGTLFFTDPTFGAIPTLGAASPQPLGFRGIYRVDPAGMVHLVDDAGNEPNGIGLSPDGTTLYVSDYGAGTLTAYAVAADGSTGAGLVLSDEVVEGDGMCLDAVGNIYATSGMVVRVFRPDGTVWGEISLPEAGANCTFGGADGRSLFIAARSSIYTMRTVIPGQTLGG